MTTLAKNLPRPLVLGDVSDYPVIASDIIFEGAAVGENASGYSRPLVAGDPFQGFALRKADNSDGSAGDINVRVQAEGVVVLPISGLAITANDQAPVYASDDNTFTLTAGSNTLVGNVRRWVSTGIAEVAFKTARKAAAVSLGDLDSGISPSHVVKYGGQITTGGGGAAEAETISGVASTDFAICTMVDQGTNTVTLLIAVCTLNTLTVTFSGDPGADAIYNYMIFRAAS